VICILSYVQMLCMKSHFWENLYVIWVSCKVGLKFDWYKAILLHPEDGGSMHLWNFGIVPPEDHDLNLKMKFKKVCYDVRAYADDATLHKWKMEKRKLLVQLY